MTEHLTVGRIIPSSSNKPRQWQNPWLLAGLIVPPVTEVGRIIPRVLINHVSDRTLATVGRIIPRVLINHVSDRPVTVGRIIPRVLINHVSDRTLATVGRIIPRVLINHVSDRTLDCWPDNTSSSNKPRQWQNTGCWWMIPSETNSPPAEVSTQW